MPRSYKTSKDFDRILTKLQRKDKKLYELLLNKMNEILSTPSVEHYKNLRYDLKEYRRVHVGSFVLVFKYDKVDDFIFFTDFNHHDLIYS
jgi:YafQ family addiction module toxin component